MTLLTILATAFLGIQGLASQTVTSVVMDGGSVQTELGYNIKVNAGSTLRRSWVVLNDSAAPARLDAAGIATKYAERERGYELTPTGRLLVSSAVTAVEVRYLLYDMFGNHIKTLSGAETRDLASGATMPLQEIGAWRASENEVSELLTVVSFIAFVRTADGRVWRYNDKSINAELGKIQLQVKTGLFDASKAP